MRVTHIGTTAKTIISLVIINKSKRMYQSLQDCSNDIYLFRHEKKTIQVGKRKPKLCCKNPAVYDWNIIFKIQSGAWQKNFGGWWGSRPLVGQQYEAMPDIFFQSLHTTRYPQLYGGSCLKKKTSNYVTLLKQCQSKSNSKENTTNLQIAFRQKLYYHITMKIQLLLIRKE